MSIPTPEQADMSEAIGVKWSEELERLHEESSRTHPVDIWTREVMLARLGDLGENATVVDVGCSAGYLLEDLRAFLPSASLIGIDLIFSGLRRARRNVPDALVVHADACHLPIPDNHVDGLVSANLLEHVPVDHAALAEIRRVLRPGGTAVLVVPASPSSFDYYDRFLLHQRRYGRGELARKCRSAGLEVTQDFYLCSLIFPAFWLVKRRNRRRFDQLQGADLAERVAKDIAKTQHSASLTLTCWLEKFLLARRVFLPFGIRSLTVAKCPEEIR